jgi:hypothetical protein
MKKKYTVTVSNSIIVEIDEDQTTLADFITEMDMDVKSRTEGAVIVEQHMLEFNEEEV